MTLPEHDSPQELAAAYALGALSPEETRRFEAFLAGSPEAQREVAEYRDVAAMLALSGPEAAPGEDLRERGLARVSRPKSAELRPARRSGLLGGALAASLLLAAGLGARLASVGNEVAQLRENLAAASSQLASREATLDAIFEPGVQMFQLTASGDPDPGIQLFWDRARNQAIVNGFRLRQVPEGRAYQLWFIRDGKPVPSVTFKPQANGNARVERVAVPPDGDVSAAAVTVEPEGGSAQPTSPILLVGPLKKS